MSNPHLANFEKDDILHVTISAEPEGGSVEVSSNITAELNDQGNLIGIEIPCASIFIRDSILETVQGKLYIATYFFAAYGFESVVWSFGSGNLFLNPFCEYYDVMYSGTLSGPIRVGQFRKPRGSHSIQSQPIGVILQINNSRVGRGCTRDQVSNRASSYA